jgi:hypothetical protein
MITVAGIISCGLENDEMIIPGKRVSEHILKKHSLKDVLGEDSSKSRKKFSNQGLLFSFDRKKLLSTITVTSVKFSTREGIKIGSSRTQVIEKFGKPDSEEFNDAQNKGIKISAMLYQGISFMMHKNKVVAIVIK